MTRNGKLKFTNYYNWLLERTEKENALLLNEGLITSYPINSLIDDISRRYKNIEYDQEGGTLIIDEIPLKQKEALERKLNLYGYFIANYEINAKDSSIFSALIEPKFPTEIPFSILHDKIKYCYHITTDKYVEKIKLKGLIPKESNRKIYKTSGNRIYFLISDNPKKDISLLKQMIVSDDKRKLPLNQPKKYHLLRINFHELNHDMVFYRDPRLFPDEKFKGQGIFTLSNIPPDKIDFLGELP
jgi:hypothetical protein